MSLYSLLSEAVNRSPINESILKSTLDANFKPKGKKDLSKFKLVVVDDAFIKEHKPEHRFLSHIRPTNKKVNSCAWFESKELAAVLSVEDKDQMVWVIALQVAPSYMGYGLSKQIMKYATNNLKATALTVASDNEVAIELYKKLGFKIDPASQKAVDNGSSKVYYMYTVNSIQESTMARPKSLYEILNEAKGDEEKKKKKSDPEDDEEEDKDPDSSKKDEEEEGTNFTFADDDDKDPANDEENPEDDEPPADDDGGGDPSADDGATDDSGEASDTSDEDQGTDFSFGDDGDSGDTDPAGSGSDDDTSTEEGDGDSNDSGSEEPPADPENPEDQLVQPKILNLSTLDRALIKKKLFEQYNSLLSLAYGMQGMLTDNKILIDEEDREEGSSTLNGIIEAMDLYLKNKFYINNYEINLRNYMIFSKKLDDLVAFISSLTKHKNNDE